MAAGPDRARSAAFAARAPTVMSRLPIRLRLTLIFGVAMLFVLAVSGLVVFEKVRHDTDARLDVDISHQAASLLSVLSRSPAAFAEAIAHPEVRGHQSFVQVLDSHGRIVAATPGLGQASLLSKRQLAVALHRRVKLSRQRKEPLPDSARLISTPIRVAGHGSAVLIVGTSLDERSASLSSLALALGIVGPIALLVATLAGYRLTAATLRPVEEMRRQAASVSATEPGRRLPLPPADDEIRELGRTLNEMLGRLEESFAHEQAFVANASHELRTPLSTLKTELDLALRRPRPPDELVAALRSVQNEVDRMTSLADDLLVLARADEGRLPVALVRTSTGEVFKAVRARFGPSSERIRVGPEPGRPLTADPRRLEQALANLVDNALRYSEGEVVLSSAANGAASTELHVIDQGPGFPPDFLDQAFERFSRPDLDRAGRGAGLGLSIVRTIARAHGGEAHVANPDGGGADAWLVIPGSPGA